MNNRDKRGISIWLLSGCFLIFLMVVIGGITRLTGSGLSITEWNLVMGAVPPVNDAQWNEAFEKYIKKREAAVMARLPQNTVTDDACEAGEFLIV